MDKNYILKEIHVVNLIIQIMIINIISTDCKTIEVVLYKIKNYKSKY